MLTSSWALPDALILNRLLSELRGEDASAVSLDDLWVELGERRKSILKGHSFSCTPLEGVELDPGKLRALDYVERKGLHFNLAAFKKGARTKPTKTV